MPSDAAFQALISAVRKLDSKRGLAHFRNAYKAAMVPLQHELTDTTRLLLDRVQRAAEAWTSDSPPLPGLAFEEWLELRRAARGLLPSELTDALLRRLPKPGPVEVDLSRIVALSASDREKAASALGAKRVSAAALKKAIALPATTKKAISNALTKAPVPRIDTRRLLVELGGVSTLQAAVDSGLTAISALVDLGKSEPEILYQSPALDVLLRTGKAAPRTVWAELAKGRQRPPDLLSGPLALAQSFTNDSSRDGPKWLLGFLAEAPEILPIVAAGLLESDTALTRLTWHVIAALTGKMTETKVLELLRVVRVLVTAAQDALARTGRLSPTVLTTLSAWRVALAAPPISVRPSKEVWELSADIRGKLAGIYAGVVGTLLGAVDAAEGSTADAPLLAVTAGEVHTGAHQFLAHLRVGGDDEAEPLERALVIERFNAKKPILLDLLNALDRADHSQSLANSVRAALFNAGVRPLGVVGSEVHYDAQLHETRGPSLLPGAAALVVEQGSILGDELNGVVLRRATVSAVAGAAGRIHAR